MAGLAHDLSTMLCGQAGKSPRLLPYWLPGMGWHSQDPFASSVPPPGASWAVSSPSP